MTHFYEKQGAGANGLGVTDKFPGGWQGSFAPSGSWQGGMPNLGVQQQQPNVYQQQPAPPSKLADVDGIQQAMQKFKKTGTDKQANWRRILAQLFNPKKIEQAKRVLHRSEIGTSKAYRKLQAAVEKYAPNTERLSMTPEQYAKSISGGTSLYTPKGKFDPSLPAIPQWQQEAILKPLQGAATHQASRLSKLREMPIMPKSGADNEAKFRNLMGKQAAQDNSVSSRSATGEGKGVTYKTKDDDHATGTAAWESIGQYMKKANETFFVPAGVKLAGEANIDEYIAGGMNTRAAIQKAYPKWTDTQIDAFLSTYDKRAEWDEKDAADELRAFMASIPQEKRASLAEFVKTSSTPGEAFELWMDKEGLDKKATWEKLAWIGPALAAGRAALPWIGRGLAKIPSMFRAGKSVGAATAAAKGSGKIMQGVHGLRTGVSAGGKQLSRTVLGRAPTGAGKFGRGTGFRGWAGRNPITALTTVPMVPGMIAGGYNAMTGGGAQSGQPGGASGGQGYGPGGAYGGQGGPIGFGTGGGQGVAPWQTHQQQPGHNPEGVAPMMQDKPYKAGMDKQANLNRVLLQLFPTLTGNKIGRANRVLQKALKRLQPHRPPGDFRNFQGMMPRSSVGPTQAHANAGNALTRLMRLGIKPGGKDLHAIDSPGFHRRYGTYFGREAKKRIRMRKNTIPRHRPTKDFEEFRQSYGAPFDPVRAGTGRYTENTPFGETSSSVLGGVGGAPTLKSMLVDLFSTKIGADVASLKEGCDKLGLTPYQLTFALRVHEANLSPQQIEAGIAKAGEYMGEEYVEELREGMDKIASMDKEAIGWLKALGTGAAKYGPKAWKGLQKLFAGGGKTQTSRVGAAANRIFEPGKNVGSTLATGKGMGWKKPLGLLGGQGQGALKMKGGLGGALRMGMGAQTGATAAGEDAPWYVKAPMMLGGAAFGRAMPRMGAGARAAGTRGMMGGFGGMAVDELAGLAGKDTGGRFGQMGALGGFASPLLRGQAIPGAVTAGKYNPLKALAGKSLPNLGYTGTTGRTALGGMGKKISDAVSPGVRSGLGWGMLAPPAIGGVGALASGAAGAADSYVDRKIQGARGDVMNDIMDNPRVQNALQMAEQGGGFMDSLGGVGNMIDPLLEMFMSKEDVAAMNPLMKILLMAGGGLGIGGLLSGSKGAGIGGLGMMAIPLIAQIMKKRNASSDPSQPGRREGVPPGREDVFLGPGRAGLPADWQGQVDPNRAALGLDQGGLGETTEMEKARGK